MFPVTEWPITECLLYNVFMSGGLTGLCLYIHMSIKMRNLAWTCRFRCAIMQKCAKLCKSMHNSAKVWLCWGLSCCFLCRFWGFQCRFLCWDTSTLYFECKLLSLPTSAQNTEFSIIPNKCTWTWHCTLPRPIPVVLFDIEPVLLLADFVPRPVQREVGRFRRPNYPRSNSFKK